MIEQACVESMLCLLHILPPFAACRSYRILPQPLLALPRVHVLREVMREKEVIESLRDVRAKWIGEGSTRAATCPGMACPNGHPIFLHLLAARVVPTSLDVWMAQRRIRGNDL